MGVLGELEPEAIANLHININFHDWSGHTGGRQPIAARPHCATNPE